MINTVNGSRVFNINPVPASHAARLSISASSDKLKNTAVLFPVRIPHQISATAAVIMIQPIEFDGLKFQVLRNPLKTLSNIPAASSHNTMNSESDTDAIPAING